MGVCLTKRRLGRCWKNLLQHKYSKTWQWFTALARHILSSHAMFQVCGTDSSCFRPESSARARVEVCMFQIGALVKLRGGGRRGPALEEQHQAFWSYNIQYNLNIILDGSAAIVSSLIAKVGRIFIYGLWGAGGVFMAFKRTVLSLNPESCCKPPPCQQHRASNGRACRHQTSTWGLPMR
ncbi:hypothetical protein GQ43DRAFT_157296 [Delitschia confertaspora ATCC 74209]|uniref:Uncharacterized protein n=1 Tax=Delitschia confertaspora ATCC 74209 TaxID=1513339 RepID=A0A9P4JFT7_9PLEO|nr:hypothetical protein GQ43DRAFT_157296 [Delitschia confertaspora ATCC 74209]